VLRWTIAIAPWGVALPGTATLLRVIVAKDQFPACVRDIARMPGWTTGVLGRRLTRSRASVGEVNKGKIFDVSAHPHGASYLRCEVASPRDHIRRCAIGHLAPRLGREFVRRGTMPGRVLRGSRSLSGSRVVWPNDGTDCAQVRRPWHRTIISGAHTIPTDHFAAPFDIECHRGWCNLQRLDSAEFGFDR
jgi:hypothetical protein